MTTDQAISEAINNRPDATCSVVRSYRGVYYAIANLSKSSASVWVLKPKADGSFFWITDYTKNADFANMLFNKAEDSSIPTYCEKGYITVNIERNLELKGWYQDLHDAMLWAYNMRNEPGFHVSRIERYDSN